MHPLPKSWPAWIPLGIVLAIALGTARAQEINAENPAPGFQASTQFPDVYLNDSFQANESIRRAKRLEQADRWDQAARLYRKVAADFGDHLMRIEDDLFVSVGDFVNRQLAAWPARGIDIYRQLYEDQAAEKLDDAANRTDLRALISLFEAYFCTNAAANAGDLAAQLALEAGNFSLAVEIYEKLLTRHPLHVKAPADVTAKLAVAHAWAGRRDQADALITPLTLENPDLRISWMGKDRPPDEIFDMVTGGVQPATDTIDTFSWPTFAGNVQRNRQIASNARAGAPLWSFDQFSPASLAGEENKSDGTFRAARRGGKFVSFMPVYADGLICFHDGVTVWALNAVSGNLAWKYTSNMAAIKTQSNNYDHTPAPLFTASVDAGRLFVQFGQQPYSFYGVSAQYDDSSLVCLDVVTGEELWSLTKQDLAAHLDDVRIDGTPVPFRGKLYAVGRRTKTFGFEDAYLIRIDGATGEIDWHTHLASASIGGQTVQRPTLSFPAIVDDTVFISTNLGAVAAIAAHDGRVRWLRLYERRPRSDRPSRRSRSTKTYPWQYGPTVCDGGKVFALPLDGEDFLILDQSDGRILHRESTSDLHDLQIIAGVMNGRLYGIGADVFAWDVESKKEVWAHPLADWELFGRPFLTNDRLLVSVAQNEEDGARPGALLSYPINADPPELRRWDALTEGGNVLVTPDQIVIAGDDYITAYAPKDEVFARLEARIAASPNDPFPQLDLAEIAFRIGEPQRAIESLDLAIDRAGGFAQIVDFAVKQRIYHDAVNFAEAILRDDQPDLDLALALYMRAAQCPPNTTAQIEYRLRSAELLQRQQRYSEAVAFYQQILLDASLRAKTVRDDRGEIRFVAGDYAFEQIDNLVKIHGPEVYAPFEKQARTAFIVAREKDADDALLRVIEGFPNATSAAKAILARAELLRRNNHPRLAARVYHQALSKYPDRVDPPDLLRRIADCYIQAEKNGTALAWIIKAAAEFPDYTFTVDGSEYTFESYAAVRLPAVDFREPRLPKSNPVEGQVYQRDFDADVKVLVPEPQFQNKHVRWDILFTYSKAKINAFDVVADAPIWPDPIDCRMTPTFLGFTKTFAVFATKHQIFAIDTNAGKIAWTHGEYPAELERADADHENFANWAAHDLRADRLFSVQDSGQVDCIDLSTGKRMWRHDAEPGQTPTGPLTASDELLVLHAIRRGQTVFPVLDAATGQQLRIIQLNEKETPLFLALTEAETLIIASAKLIYAYDPHSGDPLWSVRNTKAANLKGTFSLSLEGLYLAEGPSTIVKRSVADGQILWESPPVNNRPVNLETRVYRNEIYALCNEEIVNLDARLGAVRWMGVHDDEPGFEYRFIGQSNLVAVDQRRSRAANARTLVAYYYDREKHSGKVAKNGQVELGKYAFLQGVYCYDDHLVVQSGSTLHVFGPKPAE
jgi:outer membrane protein assembly factor BamB/TolA-binding protein